MSKAELNELVEKVIVIRDIHDLSRTSRDTLADACNVIYDNIDVLAEDCDKNVAKDLEIQMTEYIKSHDVPSLIEVVIMAIKKAEKE